MAFNDPVAWFVYVGDGLHRWRFVHFAHARTGSEAITNAVRETTALGNKPEGTYMACAAPAITTRDY